MIIRTMASTLRTSLDLSTGRRFAASGDRRQTALSAGHEEVHVFAFREARAGAETLHGLVLPAAQKRAASGKERGASARTGGGKTW
jgi:hypothetical protein